MKEIITDIDKLNEIGICDVIDTRKENELLREIIVNLKEVVRSQNLSSLSAPQLGYDKRVFVINYNGDIRTYVNPVIDTVNVKGPELSRETCSSLPGKEYIRIRFNEIPVVYQTPLGKCESAKLFGLVAKVFQHEVDHLDGLLLCDVGLEVDEEFDKATDEERQEVINMYLDSLDMKQKQLEKEIQENKDLKQVSDAIDFMNGVREGTVKLQNTEKE